MNRCLKIFLKAKKLNFILPVLFVIGILFVLPVLYFCRVQYIKTYGLELRPSKVINPIEVQYFLQNDPLWEDQKLGSTDATLGGYGCLVSVIASSLNHLGFNEDPQKVNEKFQAKSVYTDGGEVIWNRIGFAYDGVDYKYDRSFDSVIIENDLNQNLLPLVEVKYKKSGVRHWVMIVGSDEKDFLIVDPLKQSKEIARLNELHGNVFAYRVLFKK